MRYRTLAWLVVLLGVSAGPATRSSLQKMTWKVDGVEREAMVYLPSGGKGDVPVVFAFHGHGGNAEYSARKFACHVFWPEAICVYPQGLLTKTIVDPEGKLPGWQKAMGDEGDRDVHFFDAMLKTMVEEHHGDAKKVFVTGHSNGAFFTYALLCGRGEEIAAIAAVAGLSNERDWKLAKAKPIFHVAGEKDPMVKFEQQKVTIQRDKELDHCEGEGKEVGALCREYGSKEGVVVMTYIHPGGHEIPRGVPERIVGFFKEQGRVK